MTLRLLIFLTITAGLLSGATWLSWLTLAFAIVAFFVATRWADNAVAEGQRLTSQRPGGGQR